MSLLHTIAKKTLQLNKVAGVQVLLSGGEALRLSYVVLSKEKGIIKITASGEGILAEEFFAVHPAGVPVCISLDGKGILHKRQEAKTDTDPLEEVLPNANREEFYFSVLEEENHRFVSLARKEVVEKVLEEFSSRKLTIASVQLGFSAVSVIIPFADKPEIAIAHMKLRTAEGGIIDFAPSRAEGFSNKIGEDHISAILTLPYAQALQTLLGEEDRAQSNLQFQEEWLQRVLYKKLIAGVLGFFLILLLANFFAFSYLSSENTSLSGAVGENQYQLTRLKQLEEKAAGQGSLYQTLGLGKQSFFSFFADRLAATLQERTIKLKRLEIQPLKESRNRSLSFEKDKILVSGSCNNPLVINSWLEELEKQEWVKEIRDRRYVTHPQSGEGEFRFELYVHQAW